MSNNKKNTNINLLIASTISIIIILLSSIYVYKINFSKSSNSYDAKSGVLDLQGWDMKSNIDLDGQWEFYPNLLLNPTIDNFKDYKDVMEYIDVPGTWDTHIGSINSAEGAGTYRLLIKVPLDKIYGIKTKTIRLSSATFINGIEATKTGITSLNRKGFKAESKYKVGAGNSQNNEIELIVQVSSFGYRTGGIIKSIEFGTFESIMKENNRSRALEALAISSSLILGIYFLIIYLQRKEIFVLYFSFTNMIMAFYLSTMNEQLLDLIFNYDFTTRTRFQVISMILTSICILQFTYEFFKKHSNKKIVNSITIFNGILLLISINDLEKLSAVATGILQMIIVMGYTISYLYVFVVFLKAMYNNADYLEYIIIILTSLILYWVLMALKIIFEINLGNIQTILIMCLLTGVASLLSHRSQQEYKDAVSLSNKLIAFDKLKDEFLVKTSHELRTPLHIILNLTKALIEGKKGPLNEKQQENLFFIDSEGKRLNRLVEDLLDASQFNKEEDNLKITAVKPYYIIENIITELGVVIPSSKNIYFENKIPPSFPAFKVDEDKFIQIIYNLIENAVKYTERGKIIISAELNNGYGIILVEDTGVGIKEEDIKLIFDSFYQGKEEGQYNNGLGLGLSIVKHLVDIQNGQVEVESNYGEGTTFKIILPIYEEGLLSASNDSNLVSMNKDFEGVKDIYNLSHNYNVLVVDDEIANQKVLGDIISEMNIKTYYANNGEEALQCLDKEKIDLVILDFMLPDMPGDKICKIIRKKYSMAELPILVLTASGRNADLLNAFHYGANDFLKKPADGKELKSRINSLLLMKASIEEGINKEFKYFQSQISPHFLYNTLNTIIGLSYIDSEKTREALYNLSTYFRGKLNIHKEETLVSLEQELELVKAYLEIEQLRYGDRLKIIYDIDENLKGMIPPLTLQPLVENAVLHGIGVKEEGGIVKITIKEKDGGQIDIIIEDNGVGMSNEKQKELLEGNSDRIGFKNIVKKVNFLRSGNLTIDSKENEGTKITISISEVSGYESNFS